jgi:hypothetical protein
MAASRPYDHVGDAPGLAGQPSRRFVDDWAPTDGALALEWVEPDETPAPEAPPRLMVLPTSGTVPRMAWPESPGFAGRAALRAQQRAQVRRARRLAALVLLAAVALVVLLLTGFSAFSGTRSDAVASPTGPAPAQRLLPSGPPRPQVIATLDTLRVELPINQGRVTAIGYHAAGATLLPFDPVGSKANSGILGRIAHRILGDDGSGVRYYQLSGGDGPSTGGLDVGAPVGTDVYAPVDGTIVSIAPRVIDGKAHGVVIQIVPSGTPGAVLALSNLAIDPSLTVGMTVVASATKLGRLVDLSEVEKAGLERYTNDKGQHVHIEARPAASVSTSG